MSKVYYCDARARRKDESLALKMLRLFDEAGLAEVVSRGDIVAIKTHLSEIYTTRYLRPLYVHLLVEKIRDLGGKPFVTDTLSLGLRAHYFSKRELDAYHRTMVMNGFTQETVGAPIIIADAPAGYRGIPIEVGGRGIQTVSVAPAIADADCLIGLAHFKGHPTAGFGGALKNLGVGGLYKGGHYHIHRSHPLEVIAEKCNGCGDCITECPVDAIARVDGIVAIDQARCTLCSGCFEICKQKAIECGYTDLTTAARRVADGAAGVIKAVGREKCGFINLAIDITPNCDCMPWADTPFVQDQGVLVSRDPVALDQATVDLVTAAPGLPNSVAEDFGLMASGVEKFGPIGATAYTSMYGPDSTLRPDWPAQLDEAQYLDIGTRQYELVRVDIPAPTPA